MKWEQIPREEQESTINIDYCDKTLTFWTSRKSVAERLRKKVGEPTQIDTRNNLISSVTYIKNLYDKNIKAFFSVSNIVGGFRQNNIQDNKMLEEE